MVDIAIGIDAVQEGAIRDLCRMSGSHVSIMAASGELVFASVSPEYFKLYSFPYKFNCEDFSIRVSKRVLRPLVCEGCILRLTIDTQVRLDKYYDSALAVSVACPMEQDFNNEFIFEVVTKGKSCVKTYDYSSLLALRGMVNYAQTGLQVKDGLAYLRGVGFIVYSEIDHPFDFIMTLTNVTELTTFLKVFNSPQAYECGAYAVFHSQASYFGCRLPVNFVNSEYGEYKAMVPLIEVQVNLAEVARTLQSLVIQKNEMTSCSFILSKGVVVFEIGTTGRYEVVISSEMQDCTFKVPLDILKKMLSNSKLPFSNVMLRVFDSFVTLVINEISILISRED